MLKKIAIAVVLFCCIISVAAAAENGKAALFWKAYLAGQYEKAAPLGRALGKEIPEYYFLSGICYQNAFLYDEFRLVESAYYRNQKDTTKLRNLIQQNEKENPKNYQIYLLSGIAKTILPKIELSEAKTYFEKSIALNKNNPYGYNYLSLIYNCKSNYQEGIRAAEQAIKLEPVFPEPYVNLAYAYAMTNEKEKALSVLIDCMNKCPRVPTQAIDSIVNLVSKEVVITLFTDKEKYMVSALGIPNDTKRALLLAALQKTPLHRLELAEKYLEYDNWVEAKAFLEGFTPAASEQNLYYFVKARYHYLGGNKNGFYDASAKILANKPTNARHLLKIGNIYFVQSDFDSAIKFYQIGVQRVDPLDIDYAVQLNYNLGACYLKKGNTPEAKKWIEKALTIDPNDATSLLGLGAVYFNQGNKQKAKSLFLRAKRNCPEQAKELKADIDSWLKKVD